MVRQVGWTEHENKDRQDNCCPRMEQRRAIYARWFKFQQPFVAAFGAEERVHKQANKYKPTHEIKLARKHLAILIGS